MSKTDKLLKSDGQLYQPMVIYNQTIRVGFHKERMGYTFYSPNVFLDPDSAVKYMSTFIKELISEGTLPKEVIKDGQIDYSMIETTVAPCILSAIEAVDEDE